MLGRAAVLIGLTTALITGCGQGRGAQETAAQEARPGPDEEPRRADAQASVPEGVEPDAASAPKAGDDAAAGAGGMGAAGSTGEMDGSISGADGNSAAGSDPGEDSDSGGSDEALSCVNAGDVNFDCPFNEPPIVGSCAPHGDCCHRASNIAKIAALGPDEPAVLEYRLNSVEIINHPLSLGLPDIRRMAAQREDVCAGEQCLLWRFTSPRQDGHYVAGAGQAEIGVGAYNCDGSYSFFGPSAASDRSSAIGESDPGRWQPVAVPADFDPEKSGIARIHIAWVTNKNRQLQRSLFISPFDYTLDWELASSGFEITDIDTSDEGQDCMGARDRINWNTVAGFVDYSPLAGNDTDIGNQINQTYCSLLAFGLLPEVAKDKSCITTPRCLPDGGAFGDGGCDWLKLPDALCPVDEDERAVFGCHLGAEGNPNAEDGYPAQLRCSAAKPTAPLDPDMGATSVGQCCDPVGQSTTLPACNAYRNVGKLVAAAAEITAAPSNELPPICH